MKCSDEYQENQVNNYLETINNLMNKTSSKVHVAMFVVEANNNKMNEMFYMKIAV